MNRYLYIAFVPSIFCCACEQPDPIPAKVRAAIPQKPISENKSATRPPLHHTHQEVYSLLHNRLSAHLSDNGGLFLQAGSAGFAKYLRFRKNAVPWKLRQTLDGRKVAIMETVAGLYILLDEQGLSEKVTLKMHFHSSTAGRMSIRMNGKRKQELFLAFEAGWNLLETTIPAKLIRSGNNELLLFSKRRNKLSFEWIRIGGKTADTIAKVTGGKNALSLQRNAGISYYLMIPREAKLLTEMKQPACGISVRVTSEKGQVLKGQLRGSVNHLDLSQFGGKVVKLAMTATECPITSLTQASLVVPGRSPIFRRPQDKPKYVVLWIMDSLRADRLKIFVPSARPEIPNLTQLANHSTVFLQTYVQGNESRSSHASIWASVYPVNHRMFSHKSKLGKKWITIDEVAKSAGLSTSGVSGNGYVIPRRGFGNSWDKFRNHIHVSGGLRGEDILKVGLQSVEKIKTPWMLYLGTIDTHVTWRAKQPWIDRYDTKPYHGHFVRAATGAEMGKAAGVKGNQWPWGTKNRARDIERIIAIYDSNVSYQDALVGQLLNTLERWGIREQTMLIITADHGDEQWEAGRVGHGGSLRESLLHVPLLIYYPALFPPNRIKEGTEVIDIVPTIADVLGVEQDPSWQGVSLLTLSNQIGTGYPKMSMASHMEAIHAARLGPWKLRVAGSQTPRLYNLDTDREEQRNVVQDHPKARQLLEDALWMLRAYNREWKKSRWGNPANVSKQFALDMGE